MGYRNQNMPVHVLDDVAPMRIDSMGTRRAEDPTGNGSYRIAVAADVRRQQNGLFRRLEDGGEPSASGTIVGG